MTMKLSYALPFVALSMVGGVPSAWADTSDVKGVPPLIVAKSGNHCVDDPNCFNRIHYAVEPVAHVKPGQTFVLETRDGLDSDLDFNSTNEDVAAIDLDLCHPLTGPVHIDGAKRGDSIAVTVVDVAPDEFGTTTIVPGFGFLRDKIPGPYIVHWELNRLEARSKDIPGVAIPMNAFMGTVGTLPDKSTLLGWLSREKALADAGGAVLTPQPHGALPADLCGPNGSAKAECMRTVPPRENGGNIDVRELIAGTTVHLPCYQDGCGLFAGDVHFAMGNGEVAGTGIEMGARVTLRAQIIPGGAANLATAHFEGDAQLKKLAPTSFYGITGLPIKTAGELPVFSTYLGGQTIAPLENLSEDLTLAARNATIDMIDFLVKTKGLTREQAYVLASVAVNLEISQVVDVPNVSVAAILDRDIFKEE